MELSLPLSDFFVWPLDVLIDIYGFPTTIWFLWRACHAPQLHWQYFADFSVQLLCEFVGDLFTFPHFENFVQILFFVLLDLFLWISVGSRSGMACCLISSSLWQTVLIQTMLERLFSLGSGLAEPRWNIASLLKRRRVVNSRKFSRRHGQRRHSLLLRSDWCVDWVVKWLLGMSKWASEVAIIRLLFEHCLVFNIEIRTLHSLVALEWWSTDLLQALRRLGALAAKNLIKLFLAALDARCTCDDSLWWTVLNRHFRYYI